MYNTATGKIFILLLFSWQYCHCTCSALQGERATGYGVALLTSLFGSFSNSLILQNIAPQCGDSGTPRAKRKKT